MAADPLKPGRGAGEHLVEGLNHHERLVRLEGAVLAAEGPRSLERQVEGQRRRIEDLESAGRRQAMPWYVRWLGRFGR